MKVYYPAEPYGTRLFTRAAYIPHHVFSDGEEVEHRLRETIEAAHDRSLNSVELKDGIVDWPSFYHLAAQRSNLLRPFTRWLGGERVLEIGCGCGAITRFLGEVGSEVTAVEPALARAEIAALRCADLENVSVFVDDLEHFDPPTPFPFITAIGVLEYAPLYFSEPDPIGAALSRLAALLDEEGVLFIAIENQLGLRYFNGFPEEHVDLPFCGVHGIYNRGGPLTLGRARWMECLKGAGFHYADFYCPFPDYKTPRAIICPDAFGRPELDLAHILAGACGDRWRGSENAAFSEAAAWRPIVRNGLTQDLANSFLIVASKLRQNRRLEGLAYVYSDVRLPAYAKEVVFQDRGDHMAAIHRRLYPEVRSENGTYIQVLMEEPVITGEHYDASLDAIVLRPGWTTVDVAAWARPWFEFLTDNTISPGVLPKNWVDCVPANLIRKADGRLDAFDLEYRTKEGVALDFVLFRGLWNSLAERAKCAAPEVNDRTICEQVVDIIGMLMPFSPDRLNELIRMEADLQYQVTGAAVDRIERHLRTAHHLPLPALGGGGRAPLPHFQLFWRENGSAYTEENSTSVPIELSEGIRQKLRAAIPANLKLNALRFDLCDRPAILAGLHIQLLDADDNSISTVTANCRKCPAHDLAFLILPESAGQLEEVAVLLSADPHFEYELSPAESASLERGGAVALSFEYIRSAERFRFINDSLEAQNTEVGQLHREILELTAEAATAKMAMAQLTAEQQRLWGVLKANEGAIVGYQNTIRDLKGELYGCQRRLEEREAHLQQVTERLQAVLNSYTWKISMAIGGRCVTAFQSLTDLMRRRK